MVCVAQSLVFCVVLCRSLFVFSGICVTQCLVFCVMFCRSLFVFSGVRVAQSIVFCIVFYLCGSGCPIYCFLLRALFVGFVCSIYCFLCHGRLTFSGVRVAQSVVFCGMVGRLLVGFVWFNL